MINRTFYWARIVDISDKSPYCNITEEISFKVVSGFERFQAFHLQESCNTFLQPQKLPPLQGHKIPEPHM